MTKRRTTSSSSSDIAPLERDGDAGPINGAVGYKIDKQINLAQLQDEIAKAADLDSVQAASSQDDSGQVVLWLLPADLDPKMLAQVVRDHVPNPDWGVPQVLKDFQAVLEVLNSDPEAHLTAAQKESLLRGLALTQQSIIAMLGSR